MPYGAVAEPQQDEESSTPLVQNVETPKIDPSSKQQRGLALVVLAMSAAVVGTIAYNAVQDEAPPAAPTTSLKSKHPLHKRSETTGGTPYKVTGSAQTTETSVAPVDADATDETVGLMNALGSLRYESKFLFGHQNDNYLGQYFKDKDGTAGYSDVQNGTGSYPAVFGYDFADVLEGQSFVEHVKLAYAAGGVIAFDWKPCNPEKVNDACANEVWGTPCKKILSETEGDKVYDFFTGWMDTIIDEIKEYTIDGVKIPFIFRLFHENTGGWYWWGVDTYDDVDTCSDEEYKQLFNFTQDYFHSAGIHQILWEYAPAKPSQDYDSAFSSRYPGSDRIDIVAFDRYDYDYSYAEDILDDCRVVAEWAADHNKLAAIGETGIFNGVQDETTTYKDWYYSDFGSPFMTDSQGYCNQIVYALAWENANEHSYWVPLPNNNLWDGFLKLYESDYSVFADDSTWQATLTSAGYYA